MAVKGLERSGEKLLRPRGCVVAISRRLNQLDVKGRVRVTQTHADTLRKEMKKPSNLISMMMRSEKGLTARYLYSSPIGPNTHNHTS